MFHGSPKINFGSKESLKGHIELREALLWFITMKGYRFKPTTEKGTWGKFRETPGMSFPRSSSSDVMQTALLLLASMCGDMLEVLPTRGAPPSLGGQVFYCRPVTQAWLTAHAGVTSPSRVQAGHHGPRPLTISHIVNIDCLAGPKFPRQTTTFLSSRHSKGL